MANNLLFPIGYFKCNAQKNILVNKKIPNYIIIIIINNIN